MTNNQILQKILKDPKAGHIVLYAGKKYIERHIIKSKEGRRSVAPGDIFLVDKETLMQLDGEWIELSENALRNICLRALYAIEAKRRELEFEF